MLGAGLGLGLGFGFRVRATVRVRARGWARARAKVRTSSGQGAVLTTAGKLYLLWQLYLLWLYLRWRTTKKESVERETTLGRVIHVSRIHARWPVLRGAVATPSTT